MTVKHIQTMAKEVQRRSREETKQIGEDASTGAFRCEHRSIPPDHPVATEEAGEEHSSTGSSGVLTWTAPDHPVAMARTAERLCTRPDHPVVHEDHAPDHPVMRVGPGTQSLNG